MKKSYLRYYETPSGMAPLHFLWDMIFARRPVARIALKNRLDDYRALNQDKRLFPLHKKLNQIIFNAISKGNFYDYGEGYFYQSMDAIHITGLRNTEQRVAAMRLQGLVERKTVLEIGCNTGFLSLRIAAWATEVTGFDIMPHLIHIAQEAAAHLRIDNCHFQTSSFESFAPDKQFEVVISFANHATYDGQTRHKLNEYFDKCAQLCCDGGLLLFESHPPTHEGNGLATVVSLIEERFSILDRKVLDYGTFLDTGRTFIIAKKYPGASDRTA
jgi:cyclopropane fatty-acyl-phospholipid synthase-like methyltransferase